jgi:hypothetical protein
MKKDISKNKSKEKVKDKKISKKKSKEKQEKKIEEKEEEQEKKHNFIPEIEEAEEEKQFIKESKIKENKRDFIPEGLDNDFEEQLPSISGKSKVSLDRVNIQRGKGFNLDDFVENSPVNQTQKQVWQEDFDPLKYTSGISNSDAPKYLDYGGQSQNVERINMKSLSAIREDKGSFQFNPMHKQEEKSIETYTPARKLEDSELRKKKDNFVDSGKQIKYTPSKY